MKWFFLFKHWISTLLIAPLLFFIYSFLAEDFSYISSYYEEYFLFVVLGFYFSLPTYMVYAIAFYFLKKQNFSLKKTKTILLSIAFIGILLSFYVVFENSIFQLEASLLILEICYLLTSLGTGFLFNLGEKLTEKQISF